MGIPGRWVQLGLGALTASLLIAAVGQAADGVPHLRSKAKVHTDGVLTVGRQETLRVKGAPRNSKLKAYIDAPPTASECFSFKFDRFCAPQPLYSVSGGGARLRASHKGRASLTFVMPPAYELIDFSNPIASHAINLVNGQTVRVELTRIEVFRKPHFKTVTESTIADAIAVVEVPATS